MRQNPSTTPSQPEPRLALESLRVVAILLLVHYHLVAITGGASQGAVGKMFTLVGRVGFLGTDLLLALAGFLAVASRARATGAWSWLGRRLRRTFPALAIFLVGYLYLLPMLLRLWGVSPWELPFYQGLPHARAIQWSLWTLTGNYLMLTGERMGAALEPMLTLALGAQLTLIVAFLLPAPRRFLFGALAIAVVGTALRALWLRGDTYLPYSFPLCRADGFLLGAGFALLLQEEQTRARLMAWRSWIVLGASALLIILAVPGHGLALSSPWVKLVGYPIIGLWSAGLVLWLATVERCPAPVRWLAQLGPSAYWAYFLKLPACFALLMVWPARRGWDFVAQAWLLWLGLGLVGWVANRLIERPLIGRLQPVRKSVQRE